MRTINDLGKSMLKRQKIIFILLGLPVFHVACAAGLCRSNERTIFSCELKENHKFVSMCSSKNMTNRSGFIQYRYGTPNKIEFTFPKNLNNSQAEFGYDEYSRPDLSTFVVGFDSGGYRYEISETTEGGDDGATTRALLVSSDIKKHGVKLTCLDNQNAVSNISTLDRVLKCDRKHEIVDGACG
jgi:hypothetical protein